MQTFTKDQRKLILLTDLIQYPFFFPPFDHVYGYQFTGLSQATSYSVKTKDVLKYYVVYRFKDLFLGFTIFKSFVDSQQYGFTSHVEAFDFTLSFIKKGEDVLSKVVGSVPVLRSPVSTFFRPWVSCTITSGTRLLIVRLLDELGLRNLDELSESFVNLSNSLEEFLTNDGSSFRVISGSDLYRQVTRNQGSI